MKSSVPEIRQLCDTSDVVFLQETWLASDELHLLASLDDRFYGQGVSAMDAGNKLLRGRPHGGLGILWRKTLVGCKIINLPNPRIMSMHIDNIQNSMKIFNVYMPCDHTDNRDECLEILSYLNTAVEESDAPYIAMIGDFNANIQTGANTLFGKELKRFCREELMSISDSIFCPSNSFTFYSEAHQSVSWLDHCVCNVNMHAAVKKISILYDYVTSDHMPLLISLDISKATIALDDNDKRSSVKKIKWNKLSRNEISQYQAMTEQHLDKVKLDHDLILCDSIDCQDQDHLQSIDTMYNAVINALKTSSDAFNRQSTGYKQYNVIPGWNDVCKEVHSNARDAFLLWTQNGRPRSGYLLRNMQVTRATFKQVLRRCRASKTRAHADSLARKLLLKDTKSFWTEIKKLSAKGTTPIASTINEITGTEAIAEL